MRKIEHILIKPLFGGSHSGVVGRTTGLVEADYNLNQALDLYRYLGTGAIGFDVECTRHGNIYVPAHAETREHIDLVIVVCSADYFTNVNSVLSFAPDTSDSLGLAQTLKWNLDVATRELAVWHLINTATMLIESTIPTIRLSPVRVSSVKKNHPFLSEEGMRLISIAIGFGLYQFNKGVEHESKT